MPTPDLREQARRLLEELDTIKGAKQLAASDWPLRAQTLLTFVAISKMRHREAPKPEDEE